MEHRPAFSFKQARAFVLFLNRNRRLAFIGMCGLNVWLYLRIGLHTMIPLLSLTELFGFFILFSFIFTRDTEYRYRRSFISLCLAPFALNAVLLVNYLVSFHPATETYRLEVDTREGKSRDTTGAVHSHLITLGGNAYKAYPGIRVFWDQEKIQQARAITYTFQTGLFGMRVMREYTFH